MSIDKVVIQGAEFTRVADRYLLQSEVEQAMATTTPTQVPHFERLTTLLEDIVATADAVALEVAELGALVGSRGAAAAASGNTASEAVRVLRQVRDTLQDQIVVIDSFVTGLVG